MPKGSPELTQQRRDEIIAACEMLYETMGFKEITLKEIGRVTSFTRTSIYNYFRCKEEIFLAILQREYELWIQELDGLMDSIPAMGRDEFARALAESVARRPQMLKIIAMNHYDMETESRMENVVEFKKTYGQALDTVARCLQFYFPDMDAEDREGFIYVFFPFMFGIYPYTVVSDKQREAMDRAGVNYVFMSVYELTYDCVRRLLGVTEEVR